MAELNSWQDDNPRRNIFSMLQFARELLAEQIDGIFKSDLYDREMVEQFGGLLQEAWREADREFIRRAESVFSIDDEQMNRHGLKDRQLELKFRLLKFFSGRFNLAPSKETLTSLLDWINAYLPSIFGTIKGETFLDEIKKCLEAMIRVVAVPSSK